MAQRDREERGAAGIPELLRVKELRKYTMGAKDGDIGRLDDLYFDDESWTVRHLVLDTSSWFTSHAVLIPPGTVQGVDRDGRRLVTDLTRRQIEESPDIGTARPVSRQQEIGLYDYYGYPYYAGGPYRWGSVLYPTASVPPPIPQLDFTPPPVDPQRGTEDPRLRSARDVSGHGIQATDGELGHVVNYLVDLASWSIRYLIVDPRSWWPGKHVLLPTEWIREVQWESALVAVDVSREQVRSAPEYDPNAPLAREFEQRYYEHYQRPAYWNRSPESWKF